MGALIGIILIFVVFPIVYYAIKELYSTTEDKDREDKERGSAFMSLISLQHPFLLLQKKRQKLTANYIKNLVEDKKNPISTSETALDILNKRYAKGEISSEEYKTMKEDIEK